MCSDAESSDAEALSETHSILQSAFRHAATRRFMLVHFMSGRRHDETAKPRWPGLSRSKRNSPPDRQA